MDPKAQAAVVDQNYAEKIVQKFTPHLERVASQFESQARDQALKYFQTTQPDERAGIEASVKQLLSRRDHYLQLKATVLNDPGLDRSFLEAPAAPIAAPPLAA